MTEKVRGLLVKSSTVSRAIPELLAERGWSRETLAEALGLSPSVIDTWLAPQLLTVRQHPCKDL